LEASVSKDHVWSAVDHAVERRVAEDPAYPERAWFVDADEPNAGQLIARALDEGYTVVLVSPDGRERLLTAAQPAA
jgi:hypothetical protein